MGQLVSPESKRTLRTQHDSLLAFSWGSHINLEYKLLKGKFACKEH
jgi:hypothetical protein